MLRDIRDHSVTMVNGRNLYILLNSYLYLSALGKKAKPEKTQKYWVRFCVFAVRRHSG